jgi:hypothetical protein
MKKNKKGKNNSLFKQYNNFYDYDYDCEFEYGIEDCKANSVWDTDTKVIEVKDFIGSVKIPIEILGVSYQILNEIETDEFSFLAKIISSEKNEFTLGKEFYIPEQEVSGTSVNFLEKNLPKEFDVVIHRHPNGLKEFSKTDQESINSHFKISILFVDRMFEKAVTRIILTDFNLILQCQLKILLYMDNVTDMKQEITTKIKKNEIQTVFNQYTYNYQFNTPYKYEDAYEIKDLNDIKNLK